MRKRTGLTLCLAFLGACAVQPEDRQRGVGFRSYGDYAQERAAREAALSGRSQPAQTVEPASGSVAVPREFREGATGSISDEQDFNAVSARQSIESDAERREAMMAERIEIAPEAIPNRQGTSGPTIIDFALATTHPVGEARYRRSALGRGQARHQRNCNSYRSDDLAQEAFLQMGGPERDRQGLDPDGDGYACRWNPAIYRQAAAAARAQ